MKKWRDIESKYDFDVSPSTKEEYSLLDPSHRMSQPGKKGGMKK
jgi:hypothetical protein